MSDAIVLLRLEHEHLARLLDVVERRLGAIEGEGEADPGLLALAHEHLAGYPDACHHPMEDLVYRSLGSDQPNPDISPEG